MSISPQAIAEQKVHMNDDRRKDVVIAAVVCLAVAMIAVVLRFLSRRLAKARILWDDYMIIVGLVSIMDYILAHHGS